jgi:hypothetical protein
MKNPKDYKKPVALSMGILNVLYLIISLVVYKYCGSESCLPNPERHELTLRQPGSQVPHWALQDH